MEQDRRANIARALCPRVAIFSTPDVDEACRRNNVSDFANLLRPFSAVERVNVRTSTFATLNLPALHLSFFPSTELTSAQEDDDVVLDQAASLVFQPKRVGRWLARLPERMVRVRKSGALKFENEWMEGSEKADEDTEKDRRRGAGEDPDDYAPWYSALRSRLLLSPSHRPLASYDCTTHPVACIVAVSTSNPEPLNGFAQLYDASSRDGSGWRGTGDSARERAWMECGGPGVLRYYVVVHEGADEAGRKEALELLDAVKRSYGIHCALLCINSLYDSPGSTLTSPSPTLPPPPPFNGSTDPDPAPPPIPRPKANPVGLQISAFWEDLDDANEDAEQMNGYSLDGADGDAEKGRHAATYGAAMNETDVKMLRLFLREFTVQSLIPHMERSVQQWNESLTSSRPALTGRLFSAGRKYFGGSATSSRAGSPLSSSPASGHGYNAQKGFYPHQSTEAQTRRLADFAFMLHDYRFAGQTYDLVRKDFSHDKAWRYYASATRMTGLCNLMLMPARAGKLPVDVDPFLEQASSVLAHGQMPLDGLKSIAMYLEAYRAIGDVEAAAKGLLRAASGLDEALSAALLEQAALSQLHLSGPRARKFAVYMVTAAHRYEVGGQRGLSRHCLRAASDIYAASSNSPAVADLGRGWHFVRQHVVHMRGRQAFNAGQVEEAAVAFWTLVCGAASETDEGEDEDDSERKGEAEESLHGGYLEDFRQAFEALPASNAEVIDAVDASAMKALFDPHDVAIRILHHDAPPPADNIETSIWRGLEADFMDSIETKGVKAPQLEVTRTDNVALVGETLHVELRVHNPLCAPLRLTRIRLETKVLNGDSEAIKVEVDDVPDIELAPRETRKLFVAMRCPEEAPFEVTHIHYAFHGLISRSESLVRRGPRLHATKEQRLVPTYGTDLSLRVRVRSAIPLLAVAFEGLPEEALEGETSLATMHIRNVGKAPLKNLSLLLSHPSLFHVSPDSSPLYAPQSAASHAHSEYIRLSNTVSPNTPRSIPLHASSDGTLEVGTSCSIPVICHGDVVGSHLTCWLFVYQAATTGEYLHCRITHPFEVSQALDISHSIRTSALESASYFLTLNIDNSGVPDPVEVVQVASIGRRWKAEVMPTSSNPMVVDSQQTGLLALKVSPLASNIDQEDASFIVPQLERLLRGQDIKAQRPPPASLTLVTSSMWPSSTIASEKRLLDLISSSHRRRLYEHLPSQYSSIDPALWRHLFPLYSERSVDLVIFWRSPALGREGHCVHPLSIGPPNDVVGRVLDGAAEKAGGIYAESQRERRLLVSQWRRSEFGRGEDPLVIRAVVDEQVEHDFGRLGPLRLRIAFALRSLASFEVSYALALQGPQSPQTSALWVGPQLFQGVLGPHTSATVVATAWCTEGGLLDVSNYEVRVAASGSSAAWWKTGTQLLVSINDLSAIGGGYPP